MKKSWILGLLISAAACADAQPHGLSQERIYTINFRTFPRSAVFIWKVDDPNSQNPYGQKAGWSNTPIRLTVGGHSGPENYQVFFYYGPGLETKDRLSQEEMALLPSATLGHNQLTKPRYPESGPPLFLIQNPSQAWLYAWESHLWVIPLFAVGLAGWLWRRGLRFKLAERARSESALTTQVGRYALGKTLGKGAAGEVFEARAENGELCALKLLHANLREDPESNKRFLREVQICSRLHHPNIVKILDWGQQGEVLYVVMELLQGES
ncbi:protein kinase, partial [bacterium]|nr:protein kinase [bacterium]